jgi:hypothetical protein
MLNVGGQATFFLLIFLFCSTQNEAQRLPTGFPRQPHTYLHVTACVRQHVSGVKAGLQPQGLLGKPGPFARCSTHVMGVTSRALNPRQHGCRVITKQLTILTEITRLSL